MHCTAAMSDIDATINHQQLYIIDPVIGCWRTDECREIGKEEGSVEATRLHHHSYGNANDKAGSSINTRLNKRTGNYRGANQFILEPSSTDSIPELELIRIRSSSDPAVPPNDHAPEHNSSSTAKDLLQQADGLLHQQWPNSGPYVDKIRTTITQDCDEEDCDAQPELPCSYLLVKNRSTVLGHGRLTECVEISGTTRACSATFIVIAPQDRSHGLGSLLMQSLEYVAMQVYGYHYIYLWTQTAQEFYHKLGYQVSERISLQKSCLKSLETKQVVQLEDLLRRKNPFARKAETPLLLETESSEANPLHSFADNDDDVWMRKRLVEYVESKLIPTESREAEISAWLKRMEDVIVDAIPESFPWINLPWQAQVGPSCGLAALRMLCQYYRPSSFEDYSLLESARERGFSQDGEIFDIRNLQILGEEICQLDCYLESFHHITVEDLSTLLQDNMTIVLPYDSLPGAHRPVNRSGEYAHYGIIVGCVDQYLIVQQSLSRGFVFDTLANWKDSNLQLRRIDSGRFNCYSDEDMYLRDHVLIVRGSLSSSS